MQQLVIATQNPGKVAELRVLLSGLELEVLGLSDLGRAFDEPPEHGRTFEDNAALKACAYADITGLPCLADDSGLEVDALGGRPGVDSAWYAYPSEAEAKSHPREVRDPRNIELLLSELEGVPSEARTARFVCCMAVAEPASCSQGGRHLAALPSALDSYTHSSNLPHWFLPNKTYHLRFGIKHGTLSEAERQIAYDACLHWHEQRALIHALVVMPDHVHMLVRLIETEDRSLSRLLHSIKSFSANRINKARGASGPLWQREYFDRIIRSPSDAARVCQYIESNPVKAGLCRKPGEYRFLWRQVPGRLEAAPPDHLKTKGGRHLAAHSAPVLVTGPTKILATSRGTFEGRIGIPPRVPSGDNGFGYDPVFLVAPDHAHTSAELSPDDKNAISHRARAAAGMVDWLEALLRK